jgi:hypothetical protein
MAAMRAPLVVVLLTATVDPRGMVRTVVSDPDTRLREYHAVICDMVAQLPGIPVVVCDNSGRGVEQPAVGESVASWPDEVQFVSFDDHGEAVGRGKGYGEMGIIQHVLENVQVAKSADLIVKVTGRYRVTNAGSLIHKISAAGPADVVVDLVAGLTQADCRFFVASPRFLRDYLAPMRESIDDDHDVCFEHVLARAVHRAIADGLVWRSMPDVPVIVGRSGTNGRPYASGRVRVFIRRIRKLTYRLSEARPLIH